MTVQPEPDLLFALFNEIGIVNQLSTTRFERALPHGLTVSQFSVLNNFVRLGGTRSPKQLAEAFQVTKGAMTNTLTKLESLGAISIRSNPADGRAKIVEITATGKRLREESIHAVTPAFMDVARELSTEDVNSVLPVLRRLRSFLDENR